MRSAIIPVVALALAGCATQTPRYTSPKYTPTSFAAAKLDCQKQSQVPVVYGGIEGMANNEALFRTCMEAHGYPRER
jgi:hypothetical protein